MSMECYQGSGLCFPSMGDNVYDVNVGIVAYTDIWGVCIGSIAIEDAYFLLILPA